MAVQSSCVLYSWDSLEVCSSLCLTQELGESAVYRMLSLL